MLHKRIQRGNATEENQSSERTYDKARHSLAVKEELKRKCTWRMDGLEPPKKVLCTGCMREGNCKHARSKRSEGSESSQLRYACSVGWGTCSEDWVLKYHIMFNHLTSTNK